MKIIATRKRTKLSRVFFEKNFLSQFQKRLTPLLLFLFILFLPTQLGKHFFFDFSYLSGVKVDYLAPKIYLTDILSFLLISLNYPTIVNGFGNVWWLFIFLIINFFTTFVKPLSLYYSLKILQLLAVFFIFRKIRISAKIVLFGFCIGAILELFLSVSQIFYQRSLQGFFYFLGERHFTLGTPGIAKASINGIEFLRPYGTFSHPNSLAGFYLLLYFFVLTNKFFSQFIYLKSLSLFVFSALIFISFSKVAIISYLILNIIYAFLPLISKPKSKFCRVCLVARLLILLTVPFLFLQATTDPLSWQKRLMLLKNAFIIITAYPIFGVGLGNYLVVQNQLISAYFFPLNQPVHNIFLLFLTEMGLPLSLFIFYKLFVFFKKSLLFICYSLFVILITGLFDHYWLTLQQNLLLMGVVLGFSLNQRWR